MICDSTRPTRPPQAQIAQRTKVPLILLAAVLCILAMSSTLAAAVNSVYFAGDKLRRTIPINAPTTVWNFAGADVAIDPINQKMYWGDNSTGTGKIMVGNLNGSGTPTTLLTTPWVWELQIDVGHQMIYWDNFNNNTIYRSSIGAPSPQVLLTAPAIQTLRAMALDLRPSSEHLYYIDSDDVWRADLDGLNLTKLPNAIGSGSVFGGMAIDTCSDHIFATEVSNGPTIIRADLSDAGNVTVILQDPTWTLGNVGNDPRKMMLDLNAGMMYWTVPYDAGGSSTVRRANINGSNAQIIATSGPGHYMGLALDLSDTTCVTVGVNKDMQNNTGQAANDIEILLGGSYTNVNHYDGYPANTFASFTASPAAGGNTLLTWSSPNNDVQPGQIAHVGFNIPGQSVNILAVSWTRNGTAIGCVQQVSTNTHFWGSPGSQVIYANNCLGCKLVRRYVGDLKVEWYASQVPLANLNPRTRREPIRIDIIRHAPILLDPKGTARVNVPEAPRNARFGVIIHKVSTEPKLSGPDVTTDFLEFPVAKRRLQPTAPSLPNNPN